MAVFGGYETVREFYRSGLASASTARKVGGDGSDRFVVKCYQPSAFDGSDDRIATEVETFLDGARTQQKVAAAGAAHWARVHEVGTVEGGAYFVTDNHRRSVQHLIRGRVRLRSGGLYRIVSAVVRGLIEVKQACGRLHGNLKPSNILLAGKSDISRATPLLSDPAGAGHLDPQMGDVPDLHAIGELIYQLVLHRTGKAMGGYPAPDAKEWGHLGRNGTAWRQLCNRLLNPNLAPGLLTFEDLADDVEKLRERIGGPPAKLVAVAGLLAVVVVGGLVAWSFLRKEDKKTTGAFDAEAWQRLCAEYSGWVEPLLGKQQAGALKGWQKNEHLKKNVLPLLTKIIGKIKEINPRMIAKYGGNLEFLGRSPPEEAKSEEAGQRTQRALAIIDQLRAALSKEGWEDCRTLADGLKKLGRDPNDGWSGAEAYLQGLTAFPEGGMTDRVNAILIARQCLSDIQGKWRKVRELQGRLGTWDAGGVKPLERIGEYVHAASAVSSDIHGLKALQKIQEKLSDLLAPTSLPHRLAAFLGAPRHPGKPVDATLIKKEPPFAVPAGGKMADEILREGLAKLESGYYKLQADPRSPEWKSRVADAIGNQRTDIDNLEARIKKIRAQIAKGGLPSDFSTKATAQLGAIDQERKKYPDRLREAENLRAKVIGAGAYNSETRAEINVGKNRVDAVLKDLADGIGLGMRRTAKLEDDISTQVQGTLAEVRARLKARSRISATGLAEIDQAWQNWVIKGAKALLQTDTDPKALSDKAKRLESSLLTLEGRFPDQAPVKKEDLRAWNQPLATTEMASRRRHAVSTCLTFADPNKILAGKEDTNATENRDHQVLAYTSWRDGLAKIAPAFNRIEDALRAGYLLTEKPPALTATLGDFYAQWAKEPVLKDPAVGKAVQPMVARLGALKQIAALNAPARLVALANAGRQGSFEGARAAWLRLGKLAKRWPSTPAELKQEIEVRKNLSALYGLVSDAARKAALQQELLAESPGRWEAYFVGLTDVGQIEDAIGQRDEFGVKPGGRLLPTTRLRLAMYDFRRAVSAQPGKLPDAQVKKLVGDVLAKLQALPAGFQKRPDVTALMGQLRKTHAETGGGGVDFTKAGPAARTGWKVVAPTDDSVTYSWDAARERLTFRRVVPKGGQPCFLCTSEVSMGLFRKTILAARAWSEMTKLLADDEEFYGPRVWVRAGGTITISKSWLHNVPSTLDGTTHKLYAERAKPGPVTPGHPVQQVSLAAAVYFARLLNCRLPTSAEWQAAHDADAQPAQKPPNLRDKTWQAQQQHLATLESSAGVLVNDVYPDVGIFWPKGTRPDKTGSSAVVAAKAQEDGHLWFAEVASDTGRRFHHLVGNVAEYVYDKPGQVARLKFLTVKDVRDLLSNKADAAAGRVVGGSAMSAPDVPVDKPQELEAPAGKAGFSDVGFRLAFLAGRERLQSRVARLLKGTVNQGYLPASSP